MATLELLAFISGSVVTLYSFNEFKKMKGWKKIVLVISLVTGWVTGIWIINKAESKATQAENDTAYLKRTADSARKDLKHILAILKRNKVHVDINEDTVYMVSGFYKIHPDPELKDKLQAFKDEQRAIAANEKIAMENRQRTIENEKRETYRKDKLGDFVEKFNTSQMTLTADSLNRSKYTLYHSMILLRMS